MADQQRNISFALHVSTHVVVKVTGVDGRGSGRGSGRHKGMHEVVVDTNTKETFSLQL